MKTGNSVKSTAERVTWLTRGMNVRIDESDLQIFEHIKSI